jgi:hypothetical protein
MIDQVSHPYKFRQNYSCVYLNPYISGFQKMQTQYVSNKYLMTILDCSPSASSRDDKTASYLTTSGKHSRKMKAYSDVVTQHFSNLNIRKYICFSALRFLFSVLQGVSSAECFLFQDAIRKNTTVFATFLSFYLSVNPMQVEKRPKGEHRERMNIIGN